MLNESLRGRCEGCRLRLLDDGLGDCFTGDPVTVRIEMGVARDQDHQQSVAELRAKVVQPAEHAAETALIVVIPAIANVDPDRLHPQ